MDTLGIVVHHMYIRLAPLRGSVRVSLLYWESLRDPYRLLETLSFSG